MWKKKGKNIKYVSIIFLLWKNNIQLELIKIRGCTSITPIPRKYKLNNKFNKVKANNV